MLYSISVCHGVSFVNSDEQYIENLFLSFYATFLFLLSLKYNVYCSENLQNNRVQHYLRHGIFTK
jgi:hypothetical protein